MAAKKTLWIPVVAMLALAGCGEDDDASEKKVKPVAGTFVGKVPESNAFVSVVGAPTVKGQSKRSVTVFVCDAKQVCALYSGSAAANDFVAKAASSEGEAKGKMSAKTATGTITLPDGKSVKYAAGQATATTGLYDLTVKSNGNLSGVSAAGVALKGTSSLPKAGTGSLKLADGRRLKFAVTKNSTDPVRLPAGQARLIVLPKGQLRGAAKTRGGSGGSDFFIRSSK